MKKLSMQLNKSVSCSEWEIIFTRKGNVIKHFLNVNKEEYEKKKAMKWANQTPHTIIKNWIPIFLNLYSKELKKIQVLVEGIIII
jgi:hypothetical protein